MAKLSDELLFDKRIRRRNLNKGLIDESGLTSMLNGLRDMEGHTEAISLFSEDESEEEANENNQSATATGYAAPSSTPVGVGQAVTAPIAKPATANAFGSDKPTAQVPSVSEPKNPMATNTSDSNTDFSSPSPQSAAFEGDSSNTPDTVAEPPAPQNTSELNGWVHDRNRFGQNNDQ